MSKLINWTGWARSLRQLQLPFAIMATELSGYSLGVLYPARVLKSVGLYRSREFGTYPSRSAVTASGPRYSLRSPTLHLLSHSPSGYARVEQFDDLSTGYETYVAAFTQPIVAEALDTIKPLLAEDSRILDLSCGPGRELQRLAALVPRGEVVGVDFSAEMVKAAYANARSRNVGNTAFFQADACRLPRDFTGRFDAVFCCMAFHHYPRPLAAIAEMYRALKVGGVAFIIDPATRWFNQLSAPIAAWADPGWISFYSGEEFHRMFVGSGFSGFYWTELLPGIGLAIVTR